MIAFPPMTTRTERLQRRLLLRGGATALCALFLSACGPDDALVVDVEEGSWIVVAYDLEGDGDFSFKQQSCSDAALLKFVDDNVLFIARNKSMSSITDEACVDTESEWFCNCFAYSYDGSTQTWVEFAAGAVPPMVSGSSENATTIELTEDPEVADRYNFSPLPTDIFSSNGESSAYLFSRKSNSLAEPSGCEALCVPPA